MEIHSLIHSVPGFGIIRIILLIISTFGQTRASLDTCQKYNIDGILPIKQGKVLENFGFHDEVLTSVVACAKRCLRQRKCKSFNFDPTNGWCQLNTESFMSAPAGNMANHPTVSHYLAEQWPQESESMQMRRQARFLPQELLYECRWHDCSEDAVCMTDHTKPQRYNCTLDECIPVNSCVDCYTPMRTALGGRQYSPIGCYATPTTNVVPIAIGSFGYPPINETDTALHSSIIGACADATESYELFGLEYYGQCWAGNYADATFPSNEVSVGSCDTTCSFGLGGFNVMVVYKWL